VLVLAFLNNQRAANQVFPCIFLPQFFLAGVFTPIQVLAWYLVFASRIAPMRYAVDFVLGVFYVGSPDYPHVVLQDPATNLAVIVPAFVVCLVVGTFFFVGSERNR
jgi:ABC-type multidrug transport system permease subunit